MKKLFLLFFISIFLVSFASAVLEVNYSAYEGIIENNGVRTNTLTEVSNYAVKGYVCLDMGCKTLGSQVPNLNPVYSGNDVSVHFPTNNITKYGYTLYFYKDGKIGWEQYNIQASGDGSYLGGDIYLSRKRTGYAPIQKLIVVNEIHPGIPLEVNLSVGIDADTYSAIMDKTQSGLDHGESVETEVKLDIFDNFGNKLYTETKVLNIPYSGKETVGFDYIFTDLGLKNIKLTTKVTDDKIILSLPQSTTANVKVIEQGKTNYSYSILNGLIMNPLKPKVNETVSFSIDYLSRYIDEFGSNKSSATDLEFVYVLNGNEEYKSVAHLKSDGTYSFNHVFSEDGFWEVEVIGTPNPKLGNDTVTDSRSLVFFVYDYSNNQSGNITNQTNITYDYFAFLNNLDHTVSNLEVGDTYGFMFDYLFKTFDNLGNDSLMNGSLKVEIILNNVTKTNLKYNLSSNGSFYYDFEVEEGDYVINLNLCPALNGMTIGHCQTRNLSFKVDGTDNPSEPEEEEEVKTWTDNSGFEFGPSISINDGTYQGIELNKPSKGMPSWLFLIFLLLSLCLIILTCIVAILWMRKRN